MKAEPSLFDQTDEARDAKRDAVARHDLADGNLVPNDEVCAWLETWGKPDEKPAPAKWFKS